MSSEPRVWVNGELVGTGPAVSAVDHGITVGDGAFETAKIVDGRAFALTRHHDRMDRTLAGLGLPPLDRDRMDAGVEAVLAGEPIGFGRLRYTVTGGLGPLGSDRSDSEPTYVVAAVPVDPFGASTTLGLVGWTRNERAATAGLKTTSYAENVIALDAAHAVGASEALFTNGRGEVCEGTGSNVFLVRDGVVLTPALESAPLAGITRALVLEWCAEAGIPAREEVLPLSALAEADEVFLTSSTRDVQAVGALAVHESAADLGVGDLTWPAPGPVTTSVAELFARLSTERTDP